MFMLCYYSVCSSPLQAQGHIGLIFLLSAVFCTLFSFKFPHIEVPYAVFENFFLKDPCDSSSALPSSLGMHRGLCMRQEAPEVRVAEIKLVLQTWITHRSYSVQYENALLPLLAVGFDYNQHLAQ